MARGAHLFFPLTLFLVALLARLSAIGRYVTPDELNWVYRSLGLRRALLAGDWQETLQSGHPGVTTTWIGSLTAQIQLWLQPDLQARLAWLDRLQQLSTDNVEAYRHLYAFLNGGRLGVGVVSSLCLVLVFMLARDHLGPRAAFLGALLLALDPYFAGLSGLLHVDGLLATFMLLALLLAMRAAQAGRSPGLAAGAGLFTALAVLTKTPALILLAFVPLVLLWPAIRGRSDSWKRGDRNYRRALGALGGEVFKDLNVWAWGVTMLLVANLLLPALWAAPGYVAETISGLSGRLLEDAVRPTFFLGRTALDHGPLFYPIVVLFRLSPVAFAGVALALPALRRRTSETLKARWLFLFAVAFLFAISLAAKKFDRYALPSLATLTLLGGWGLVQAANGIRGNSWRLLATALLLQIVFLISVWPHPLAAANWLVGGNAVARHVLPRGWGEDAGLAARALSVSLDQPQQATLFSSSLTGTAPFFPGEIIRLQSSNLTRLQSQDFLLTLPQDRQLQPETVPRGASTAVAVRGVGNATLNTGLDAAELQLPSFAFQPRDTRFGVGLRLLAAGSVFLPWPQETLVGLTWETVPAAESAGTYRLQLELVNDAGQVWLHREMTLLNGDDHVPADWPSGAPQTAFYHIRLPAALAPGSYKWVVRLFDAQGRQQGVFTAAGAFAGTQAAVAAIEVTPPPAQPAVEAPYAVVGDGPVTGHGGLPQAATAGDPFSLELWWRAQEEGARYALVLEVDGRQAEFALDTRGWREGQVYQVRPVWRLPLEITAGDQALALRVRNLSDDGIIAGPLMLGRLQIERRERRFELPQAVDVQQIAVGEIALLQDVTVEVQEQAVLVHVIWQARETTFDNFTTFVHLRDGERVIGGDDRQPSPPTSAWAPGQIITETYTLPRPAAGTYAVALGLYDASNGARLPLRDGAGQVIANDQFLQTVDVP